MLMTTESGNLAKVRKAVSPEMSTIDEVQPFYIVRCLRGSDQQVIAGFHHRGILTYYPRIIELKPIPLRQLTPSQRYAGVKVMKPCPSALFPRYVFIQADLRAFDWQDIFEQTGAGGFTCEGRRPVAVRPNDLAKIRARENDGLIDGRISVRAVFGIGDEVTVTSGPFASYPGIVEKGLDVAIGDLDPKSRIIVAVNIFGQATPVELEIWQVAKQ